VAKPAIPERRFPAATIRAQIEAILRAWGMPEDALRTTAEVMVETDLAAIDSHGVAMLAMYDRMQQAGRLRLDAQPRVVRESASTALIDGGAGIEELSIERRGLHDAFVQIAGEGEGEIVAASVTRQAGTEAKWRTSCRAARRASSVQSIGARRWRYIGDRSPSGLKCSGYATDYRRRVRR